MNGLVVLWRIRKPKADTATRLEAARVAVASVVTDEIRRGHVTIIVNVHTLQFVGAVVLLVVGPVSK